MKMTKQEYVEYCNECKNKKYNSDNEIICGLTEKFPDFDDQCISYEEDTFIQEKLNKSLKDKKGGLWRRAVNVTIDSLFILFFAYSFGILIELIIEAIDHSMLGILDKNIYIAKIYLYLVYFFYYSTFEGFFGRTIGKMITGTKVVGVADGGKINFGTAMLRTIIRFVPFDFISLFGSSKTCFHDEWSKTRVVRNNFTN